MIRRLLPLWVWGLLAVFFMMLAIGLSIGFTVYWVHRGFSNECEALNYILVHGNRTGQNAPFYHAVTRWAIGDGCR